VVIASAGAVELAVGIPMTSHYPHFRFGGPEGDRQVPRNIMNGTQTNAEILDPEEAIPDKATVLL
jgi:hypothetical protein